METTNNQTTNNEQTELMPIHSIHNDFDVKNEQGLNLDMARNSLEALNAMPEPVKAMMQAEIKRLQDFIAFYDKQKLISDLFNKIKTELTKLNAPLDLSFTIDANGNTRTTLRKKSNEVKLKPIGANDATLRGGERSKFVVTTLNGEVISANDAMHKYIHNGVNAPILVRNSKTNEAAALWKLKQRNPELLVKCGVDIKPKELIETK